MHLKTYCRIFFFYLPGLLFCQDLPVIDFSSTYSSNMAVANRETEPEYFKLLINNDTVLINSRGYCKKLNFRLNVDKNCVIETLHYFQENSIIYFNIVESDFDAAGSRITKFDLRRKKALWQNDSGGFNTHNFIVYKDHIYVNAIGFLGKINAKSGKYVWKHDDLYEKYKANYFINLIISNNIVAAIIARDSNEFWKMFFDDKTGKLIKIVKNDS